MLYFYDKGIAFFGLKVNMQINFYKSALIIKKLQKPNCRFKSE